MHSFQEYELKEIKENMKEKLSEMVRDPRNFKGLKGGTETFYCNICYDDKNIEEIFLIKCGHYFCKPCFVDYFEYLVSNGKVYSLKCPHEDC